MSSFVMVVVAAATTYYNKNNNWDYEKQCKPVNIGYYNY